MTEHLTGKETESNEGRETRRKGEKLHFALVFSQNLFSTLQSVNAYKHAVSLFIGADSGLSSVNF